MFVNKTLSIDPYLYSHSFINVLNAYGVQKCVDYTWKIPTSFFMTSYFSS